MIYNPTGPCPPFGYVPYGATDVMEERARWSNSQIIRSENRKNTLYLCEIDADKETIVEAPYLGGNDLPFGLVPYGGTWSSFVPVLTKTTLRFCNRTVVFADTDEPVQGRLQPFTIRKYLDTLPDGTWAPIARYNVGEIILGSGDGALDTLPDDFIIEGRPIRILRAILYDDPNGRLIQPKTADFGLIFTGIIDSWYAEVDDVRIKVTDTLQRLNSSVVRNRYPDTTGADTGVASLYRPYALGECRNIPLTREDTFFLVFRAHQGSMLAVDAVKDQAVTLAPYGDVGTLAELQKLTTEYNDNTDPDNPVVPQLPLGYYATCLNEGLVRLGGLPFGVVTADVRGEGSARNADEPFDDDTLFDDNTGWTNSLAVVVAAVGAGEPFDDDTFFDDASGWEPPVDQVIVASGDYADTMVALGLRLLSGYARLAISQTLSVDSWNALDILRPFVGGFFLHPDQEYNLQDVLTVLLQSANACLIVDRNGKLVVRQMKEPTVGYRLRITPSTMKLGTFKRLPLNYTYPIAIWRGLYDVNNRLQSETEIAGIVQGADRINVMLQGATIDYGDLVLKKVYFDRGPSILQTALKNRDQVARMLDERLTLFGPGHQMFSATVLGISGQLELMETVQLVHPRFGLSQGKNFLVVDINEQSGGRQTDLVVWG